MTEKKSGVDVEIALKIKRFSHRVNIYLKAMVNTLNT